MTYRTSVYVACSMFVFAAVPLGQLASQSRGDPPSKKEEKKAAIEWGPEKNGVRCAVALPPTQERVFAGEPVQVLFLTKNVGKKLVSIVTEGQLLSVFTISVQGPDGKPAPFTSYGRQQMDSAGGSRGGGTLVPGKEDTFGLLLSRIFDMTRTGEYKVSFSRSVTGADDTEFSVTSSALTITVALERADYVPN